MGATPEEIEAAQRAAQQQQNQSGNVETITIPPPPPPPPTQQTVPSDDDLMKNPKVQELLEKARQQEKDKLYPQLEELKDWRKDTEKKERERAESEQQRQTQAEETARLAAEEEMSAKELLAQREQEWNSKFTELQQETERERALREQETLFNQLTEYKAKRIQEESENIIPSLTDFITGNSPEEIEASIAKAVEKSAEILEASTNAMQVQRQQMKGTSITGAPPVGPSDMGEQTVTLTPDQIRNMSMEEYAKHRETLLGAASDRARNRGLTG